MYSEFLLDDSDDYGASRSSADTDRSPGIPKRKISSLTDPGLGDRGPKRPYGDSTGNRELEKYRTDLKEQDIEFSVLKETDSYKRLLEKYPSLSRNESGMSSPSKEGFGKNILAAAPQNYGTPGFSYHNTPISGTSVFSFGEVTAPKPFMPNNPSRLPYVGTPPGMQLPVTVNRQRIDDPVFSGAPPSQSLRNYGAYGSLADTAFFGMVTSPLHGVHEMKIGSVTFQVKTGDIIKEKTDVIVNSSNQDFTRYSGVSKAILDAAGPPIASSAAALGSRPHKGYVITGSGRLKQLEWILHVVGPTDPTSTKKIVLDVLQECENLQVSSVTFPALGTGAGGLAASTVADSILDGLVDFIKSKSVRSLQTVKVVLLLHSMLTDFYMSMKMREGTPLSKDKSSVTRLSDGDTLRLPSHWKPMGETRVIEVDIPLGTPEYVAVQLKFLKSCRNQIVKILRVQNRDLWLQYQIKKQSMDSQNGSTTNEKELFHGTDVNSIQNVNHKGFNRSYAGRHAAAYGNGTYFAVNANYSATETYSNPDGNGRKHMYLARVLTGLYCVGRHGMKAPPAKNTATPTDCYDSVTDDVQNPSMFVIFNDVQAYPEYHIVFQ